MSKSILIVDDSEDTRLILRGLLEKGDEIVVTEAADGEQALRQLRSEIPDAMLLDVMMPEINGFAVLTMMQRDPATRQIPVILLSALDLRSSDLLAHPNVKHIIAKGSLQFLQIRQILEDLLNIKDEDKQDTQTSGSQD